MVYNKILYLSGITFPLSSLLVVYLYRQRKMVDDGILWTEILCRDALKI